MSAAERDLLFALGEHICSVFDAAGRCGDAEEVRELCRLAAVEREQAEATEQAERESDAPCAACGFPMSEHGEGCPGCSAFLASLLDRALRDRLLGAEARLASLETLLDRRDALADYPTLEAKIAALLEACRKAYPRGLAAADRNEEG